MSDKGFGAHVSPLLKHLRAAASGEQTLIFLQCLHLCLSPSSYRFGMCILFLRFACYDASVQPFYPDITVQ